MRRLSAASSQAQLASPAACWCGRRRRPRASRHRRSCDSRWSASVACVPREQDLEARAHARSGQRRTGPSRGAWPRGPRGRLAKVHRHHRRCLPRADPPPTGAGASEPRPWSCRVVPERPAPPVQSSARIAHDANFAPFPSRRSSRVRVLPLRSLVDRSQLQTVSAPARMGYWSLIETSALRTYFHATRCLPDRSAAARGPVRADCALPSPSAAANGGLHADRRARHRDCVKSHRPAKPRSR